MKRSPLALTRIPTEIRRGGLSGSEHSSASMFTAAAPAPRPRRMPLPSSVSVPTKKTQWAASGVFSSTIAGL